MKDDNIPFTLQSSKETDINNTKSKNVRNYRLSLNQTDYDNGE
jgi:hypothetical protein